MEEKQQKYTCPMHPEVTSDKPESCPKCGMDLVLEETKEKKQVEQEYIMKTEATLTCPQCSEKQKATMPTDACQHFYNCQKCGEMLKPKEGDCCVFCSYADTKCPPKQLQMKS